MPTFQGKVYIHKLTIVNDDNERGPKEEMNKKKNLTKFNFQVSYIK